MQRQSASHIGNTNSGAQSGSSGIGVGGVAIGSMIGNLASKGATMLMGAVTSGIGEMITQSMQKEQAITGLTTFLGKKGATDAYKNIRADANATPYDTASLLEVNRSLISAGLNAKSARTDTLNLANAVSAVGGGNDVLSRMAANMQQIKTVGKATAMDIRQFGIAGINIYAMLARSTGKSIAQVKEMEVTYEDLAKSLAMSNSKGGIYEGAMDAQGKTKSGKWNTVKDNFSTAASDLGDAFSPVINKFLDMGIKFADGIGPMIERAQPYIDSFSNSIGKGVDYVTDLISGTGKWSEWVAIAKNHFNIMWPIIQNIAVKLWEFVSRIVEFVRKSEILKDVFKFIGWYMKNIGAAIGLVLDGILWVWDNLVEPILNKIEAFYKWIKGNTTINVKGTKTLIAPKKPKGESPEDSPLGAGGALVSSNASSGKAAGTTVAGAGPKVVNIHVGKFFENLQFTTMNANESANEIERVVMECFARVVYNGSKTV
ncbi:tape measure protein [Flavobacterium sp. AC]|uniref:Tape measure protein n=1 Tax=Flavobacterium azizsancarii TaxID=2961580 RepID=A0ABT4WHX9_9FLAO|nr:tape measure protein [Flavobacterium azizsancarii]MDA6072087.1 tape measure protein [Flavobacterium azizsancarii]